MSDTVYLKVKTDTGYPGASHEEIVEFPRKDWDESSLVDRENLVETVGMESIDIFAEIVDENGDPTGEAWYDRA